MTPPERLLAKSALRGEHTPSHFLPGHLRDVYQAAEQLLACTADEQLKAVGLDNSHRARLERIVLLASAAHDLGKANSHFMEMITGKRDGLPQGLRHEWVSLLVLTECLRDWLIPAVGGSELDWQIALWAVAGHHPAYDRPSPPRLFVVGGGKELVVWLGHEDFRACLGQFREWFGLDEPPKLGDVTYPLVGPGNAFSRIFDWYRAADVVWQAMKRDDPDSVKFVAAAKVATLCADVAGSALPRSEPDESKRAAWIGRAFANRPPAEAVEEMVGTVLDGKAPRPFQDKVSSSAGLATFVKAGCGTGKTVAAYLWAARRHPGKRVYFCYPTTGTATEGFRDYLMNLGQDVRPELFHGRSEIDLDLLPVSQEPKERTRAEDESVARIESLEAWSTPIVSCTVDTVLGLVQNNRRGLFAWPALAGSAFVFDEIHAYDDRLFGALIRFLLALPGVPVLMMTASLPQRRLEALRRCCERRETPLERIEGPAEIEAYKRYQRHGPIAPEAPDSLVRDRLANKGKVLWVCNTVDRVMRAAERFVDLSPLIYHSRFRYRDRVERHGDVIKAFKGDVPVLAICSQVAEMSLDLSATLFVTDLAPVPALIQRLGRLNRRADRDDAWPFVVVEPVRDDGTPAVLPYTAADLAAARNWLESLGDGPLSQADLAEKWESDEAERRPELIASAWLDGGPVTQVLELREASPGVSVILERDEGAAKQKQSRLAEFILPMPPPPRGLDWRKGTCRGVPVAREDSIEYCQTRGGRWRRK
jgi:CRISPR-associated endonuclease/helicase Cas3